MIINKVKVTPAMARKWLENNGSNRRLRENFVLYIMDEIKQGRWQLTHQGVAISSSGLLLDGQHRLTAIARLGVSVEMWVATDCDYDNAFGFQVDNGEKRTIADIMGESNKFVALINMLLSLGAAGGVRGKSHRFTTAERDAVIAVFGQNLHTFCSMVDKNRRGVTSARFRAPIFVHWMLHGDEIISQYLAFVELRQQDMWPRVDAFNKQIIRDERIMKGDYTSQVCRIWTAFDPTKKDIQRIMINENATHLSEIKKALGILGLNAELAKLESPQKPEKLLKIKPLVGK